MPSNSVSVESPKKKRPYQQPRLVTYGAVRDLTQAGTGITSENNPANGAQCGQYTKQYWGSAPCSSDRGIKQDLVQVGVHPLGIGLYLFHYKTPFRDQWGHGRQFGVMAQEVEAVMPEAVSVHPDGYKLVDYGMLGINRAAN